MAPEKNPALSWNQATSDDDPTLSCATYAELLVADHGADESGIMEIQTVRDVLKEVALDHSGMPADEAIKKVAVALLHLAEAIHKLESDVTRLRPIPSRKSGYSR